MIGIESGGRRALGPARQSRVSSSPLPILASGPAARPVPGRWAQGAVVPLQALTEKRPLWSLTATGCRRGEELQETHGGEREADGPLPPSAGGSGALLTEREAGRTDRPENVLICVFN
ncbi:hypothetical protein NDU88_005522 [Pleurodeles waltl]|uniref:Uncharacterized protein n=1 Tax=Pleurodeles waltl TaxID=8319 RepID=A0AAV7LLJ0_PLEWA|nr:hypothetical protein NDU88_005522 [Pleurodeles waltl]